MSETEWKAESPENKTSQVEIPDVLPLLPIRDIVIYPYMMLPLFVGRDVSIRAVEEALVPRSFDFSGFAEEFRRRKSQLRRTFIESAPSRRSCACSNWPTAGSKSWSRVWPRAKSTLISGASVFRSQDSQSDRADAWPKCPSKSRL